MADHFYNPHFKLTPLFDSHRLKLASFCLKNNYLFLNKSHLEMNPRLPQNTRLVNEEDIDNFFIIDKNTPLEVNIRVKPVYNTDSIYLGLEENNISDEIDIYNKEVEIECDDMYLTACYVKNKVYFSYNNKNDNSQRWFIEKDEKDPNIFYIKTSLKRYNYSYYLGSPNQNNRVFLYSSKNEFTQWNIKPSSIPDLHIITYVGDKFNPKEVQIVLARYNECVDWAFAYEDIVIVYDKCDIPTRQIPNFKHYEKMENIGREGHTYLTHIIRNYYSLPERTFFLQGYSFDHNITLLFAIDNYKKNMGVQPLGLVYEDFEEHQHPPTKIINKYKHETNYGLEYCVVNINGDLQSEDYYDTGMAGIKDEYITQYKYQAERGLNIVDAFLERANISFDKTTEQIRFTFSALFSVSNKFLLKNNCEIYKNILNELISLDKQAGINGYILERLWLYILE
jgi:hypothetical protein